MENSHLRQFTPSQGTSYTALTDQDRHAEPRIAVRGTEQKRQLPDDELPGETPQKGLFGTKTAPSVESLRRFGWWWELGAIITSLLAVVVILAMLFVMDRKPLSSWKLPIQINSLVAIFSTLARSALLLALADGISQLKWNHFERRDTTLNHLQTYDDASRGPWGSLMYLIKIRRHATGLGALGAALTILALAFEPFTQQIIDFPSIQTANDNGTAYVTVAKSFALKGWSFGSGKEGPKLALMREIINILPDPTANATEHFTCPANSCHMPMHWSLAACTTCSDYEELSSEDLQCSYWYNLNDTLTVEKTKNTYSLEEFKKVAKANGAQNWSSFRNGTYGAQCERNALGNQQRFKIASSDGGVLKADSVRVVEPFGVSMLSDQNVTIRPDVFTAEEIFSVWSAVLTTLFPTFADLDSYNGIVVGRRSCNVTYCARKTEVATIDQGKAVVSEKDHPIVLSNACGKDRNCSLISAKVNDDASAAHFWLDTQARLAFGDVVAEVFNRMAAMEVMKTYITKSQAPEVARILSTATSALLRSSQNANSSTVAGSAMVPVTYVYVRWQWATLPGLIVFLSVAFLVLTMLESGRGQQLFKTSVLTGYFHGFDPSSKGSDIRNDSSEQSFVRKGLGDRTYYALLDRGKEVKVRLSRNDDGELRFIPISL
ncbi:hypothetical protein NX059_004618 [Plenodomus lindquistii]|nr:hypothetical protein NX059_004618 [Plenodomus lindquistii]